MQVVFCLTMFIFGACLGSFLCCQARRLRLKEIRKPKLGKRSVCMHCKHQLKWYENLPIISWIIQKGKCRNCHKKIGLAELLAELGTGCAFLIVAISFLSSFTPPESVFFKNANPFTWGIFLVTILLALSLCFLAIYDGLYGELPSFCLAISAVLATIIVAIRLWSEYSVTGITPQPLLNILYAIAVLGGIYLVLYIISRGKWVGDGDWILGSIIASVLGTPWLALIALFIANFFASIVAFPLIRKQKDHKIFFGPFLVFAFFTTLLIASFNIFNL